MDAQSAARVWVDEWTAGWLDHDADRIVALYADDAVFVSAPFRQPKRGREGVREYVQWAFAEEDAVDCRFGEPLVTGDRAVIEYSAVITFEGLEQSLAGVALIEFDSDGRVVAQRDYWHIEKGRLDPASASGLGG